MNGPSTSRITTLPRPTSTILRSSLIVPTYPSVLRELIHNSLDAHATSIEIWISLTPGFEQVRVQDDGCGIARKDLQRIGGRHETSKAMTASLLGAVDGYGFRGEALSSIAELGIVSLATRTATSKRTLAKVIKVSYIMRMALAVADVEGPNVLFEGESSRSIAGRSGTIVTVKELFHNIPVRQRALAGANPQNTLMECRRIIETLALVHPGVRWSMWDESVAASAKGGAKKVLGINQSMSSLDTFRAIYGTAGVEKVQKIRVTAGRRKVEGFISLEGMVNKPSTPLYVSSATHEVEGMLIADVNSYPLQRGDLQHAISKRFAASRFSASTQDSLLEDHAAYVRKSPRKLERHPIYVLNVILPPEEVDALYGPQKVVLGYKDEDQVTALLIAVVDGYLERHGFAGRPASVPSPTPSPSRVSVPVGERHPDASRLESRRSTQTVPPISRSSAAGPPSSGRLFADKGKTARKPARNAEESSLRDEEIAESPFVTPSHQVVDRQQFGPLAQVPRKRRRTDDSVGRRDLAWLQDLITRSRSRIRARFHPRPDLDDSDVPCLPDPCPDIDDGNAHELVDDAADFATRHARPVNLSRFQLPSTEIAFSTSSLLAAEVLGQVDRKFIACSLWSDASEHRARQRALVVIDQHAADERIRVEQILAEICSGFLRGKLEATSLSKTMPTVVLSREELGMLHKPGVVDIFARWGISLDLPVDLHGPDNDYAQVQVTAVPALLVTRLAAKDAREMTRLIKLYLLILDRHIDELRVLLDGAEETEVDWGRAMRWIPQEMLELANSKACRGAIMFGDVLDHDQCDRLVQSLATTRQGFICAHGRPSLVPLAVLEGSGGGRRKIDWSRWAPAGQSHG